MTQKAPFNIAMHPDEADLFYQRYLDALYPAVTIAGKEYSTSLALRKTDWVAYRQGLRVWADRTGIAITL